MGGAVANLVLQSGIVAKVVLGILLFFSILSTFARATAWPNRQVEVQSLAKTLHPSALSKGVPRGSYGVRA